MCKSKGKSANIDCKCVYVLKKGEGRGRPSNHVGEKDTVRQRERERRCLKPDRPTKHTER